MNEDGWRRQEQENDAANGRRGWWLVSGMVDEQWVYADSAVQAVERADNVPSWQNPTAMFVGRKP